MHLHGANQRGISLRNQHHVEAAQDAGQNLALPLVGDGVRLGGGFDLSQNFRRCQGLGHGFHEGCAAVTVVAAGGHDDDAALFTGGFRGGHALDGLIDILIQGVAVVGGEDDVGRNFFTLAQRAKELDTGKVCLLDITGKRAYHFVPGVDDHIADEGQLCGAGGIDHIFMDGVTLQNAGAGERTCNEVCVVIPSYCCLRGDTRQNALSSAGEAGEEMGLDEAFADEQVGILCQTVDTQLTAGGKRTDGDHVFFRGAVVNDNSFGFYDFSAEFLNQLFFRGAAVAAGGD